MASNRTAIQVNLTESINGTQQSASWVTTTITSVLLSLGIPSAFLSLFISIVAYKLFKSTRDPVHLFILSMAIGDFLVTGIASPIEAIGQWYKLLNTHIPCMLIHICNFLGLAISAISLSMLNVDKLIYFQWPLHYDVWMSTKRSLGVVVGLWIMCIVFVSSVWVIGPESGSIDIQCQDYIFPKIWYGIHTILFCTVPILSSAVLSLYLYFLTRKIRGYAAAAATSVTETGRVSNLRSLFFIFVTTAWTVTSLLPFRLYNSIRLHLSHVMALNSYAGKFIGWFLYLLLMLNPIVNPVITATIYAPYRQSWQQICVLIWSFGPRCKLRRTPRHSRTADGAQQMLQTTAAPPVVTMVSEHLGLRCHAGDAL